MSSTTNRELATERHRSRDRASGEIGGDTRSPASRSSRLARMFAWAVISLWIPGHASLPETADPQIVAKLVASMATAAEDADHFDAEVWLKRTEPKLSRYVKDAFERRVILAAVYREANRHTIDPDLVLAVMHVESYFDRFAVSRVGAQGLMQVMPFWRLEIGRDSDNLTEIETNVRYGTAILAHYIGVANGDLVDALARYNGSTGRLKYPELVVGRWRKTWQTQTTVDLPELRESCLNYRLKACW